MNSVQNTRALDMIDVKNKTGLEEDVENVKPI
jgi:hypothetical protein